MIYAEGVSLQSLGSRSAPWVTTPKYFFRTPKGFHTFDCFVASRCKTPLGYRVGHLVSQGAPAYRRPWALGFNRFAVAFCAVAVVPIVPSILHILPANPR
jgi:hypothetical protein